jgi:hypothetical protein
MPKNIRCIREDDDGRELIVLYVGDFDPSGMNMSEEDLPARFAKYGGDHITLQRIALVLEQLEGLPSFPASDKRKDPRYKWFVANYGHHCWELDAMDPNDLRDCVEREIVELIEPVAWQRCEVVNHPVKNAADDNLCPRGGGAFVNEIDGNLTAIKDADVVTVHWQVKFRGVDFAPINFVLRTDTYDCLRDKKGRPMPTVVAKHLTEAAQEEMTQAARSDDDMVLQALKEGPAAFPSPTWPSN